MKLRSHIPGTNQHWQMSICNRGPPWGTHPKDMEFDELGTLLQLSPLSLLIVTLCKSLQYIFFHNKF